MSTTTQERPIVDLDWADDMATAFIVTATEPHVRYVVIRRAIAEQLRALRRRVRVEYETELKIRSDKNGDKTKGDNGTG